jgi:transposase
MGAATTAIAAKAQNVTTRPAAPATAPAVSAPKTCPMAMSRKAAPSPADGRSWNLLSDRREDLVSERTRVLNRLHGLLRDLIPGGVPGRLSVDRASGAWP